MLARLFKRRRGQISIASLEDPSARLAALAQVDDDHPQEALSDLAQNDTDARVRRAAIAQLQDIDLLIPLLDGEHQTDAARQLVSLSNTTPLPATISQHPKILHARIVGESDLDKLSKLLDQYQKQPQNEGLAILAVNAAGAEARHHIAAQIWQEPALNELERLSRSRDKTINRLARGRLSDLKSARARLDELTQQAEELQSALNPPSNDNALQRLAKMRAVNTRWDQLSEQLLEANRALEPFGIEPANYSHHRDAIEAQIKQAEVAVAADQEAELAPSAPAVASAPGTQASAPDGLKVKANLHAASTVVKPSNEKVLDDVAAPPYESLLEQLQSLTTQVSSNAAPGDEQFVQASAELIIQQWRQASTQSAPAESLSHQFEPLAQALSQMFSSLGYLQSNNQDINAGLDRRFEINALSQPDDYQTLVQERQAARTLNKELRQHLRACSWPPVFAARQPEILSLIQQRREAITAFLDASGNELDTLRTTLEAQVQELAQALEEGKATHAMELHQQIRRFVAAGGSEIPKELQQSFRQHNAKVQELRDWQRFATSPKREELVTQIETIAREPLPPAQQAERIKSLRSAWRALGPVHSAADHELRTRFNEYAETAFEPCRGYFENQAQIRAENLAARETICEQLQHYLNENQLVTGRLAVRRKNP